MSIAQVQLKETYLWLKPIEKRIEL
jgi:hypothetical protein